ncbi:pentapeptide repeat-containing protein [Krasilnikovia cinnamomea]
MLRRAKLRGAKLRRARLRGAKLRRARLRRAGLQWAKLRGARLRRAKLRGARLQWARLRGARLQWARLRWTGPVRGRRSPGPPGVRRGPRPGLAPPRRGTRPCLVVRTTDVRCRGTRPRRRRRRGGGRGPGTPLGHPRTVVVGQRLLQVRLRVPERCPAVDRPDVLGVRHRAVPGGLFTRGLCTGGLFTGGRRALAGGAVRVAVVRAVGPGRRVGGGRIDGGVEHRGVHRAQASLVARVALAGHRLPLPGDLVQPAGLVVPAAGTRVRAPAVHLAPGRVADAWRRSVTTRSTLSGNLAAAGGHTGYIRPAPLLGYRGGD